ncbi:putative efflux protein, MATE family [Acetitomaculum ruminis DSM 5522]|uniref:Multidrug export protein MepA n=1 Tax=Acetitomaculum ruminis DSM 5522 TaxID=1120918 RepID=A0A1I0YTR3_9FIRM|nr:MATE family efflux transporter [Acetitomaculum ruminis]SFB16684.1 putative efflux protein, MATE family [Acetitomaculum ruminis DSM 5522]
MKSDFSQGKMWKNIMAQSFPLMLAQIIQLLYSVVDRIYIGHLKTQGSLALSGIGLTFPVITLIIAFTNLFSSGGAPLFSIARGEKNEERAKKLLGEVFTLIVITSFIIFAFFYAFKTPVLYLFGASDKTVLYGEKYLNIYLFGTLFSMVSTGLVPFINASGHPGMGMCTIVIGAVLNMILDPIFIFFFSMGIEGAALTSVISQFVSFLWVMFYFHKKDNAYRLELDKMRLEGKMVLEIIQLGLAGFIMQATSCLVQIVCNRSLKIYGGDLYVGIMTVLNSVREIFSVPPISIGGGAQPILGYNYGAKKYKRVKEGIKFTAILGLIYLSVMWLVLVLFPKTCMSLFSSDEELLKLGSDALRLYFFGFCFMALQFAGQCTFTALGCSKRAIFFSLLRKVIIVVPLTLLLPGMGFGVDGVFLAEPISNALGGTLCFVVMYLSLYKKLPDEA